MVNYLGISSDKRMQGNSVNFWIKEWIEYEIVKKVWLIHADQRYMVCQELNQSLLVLGIGVRDGVEAVVEK